MRLITLNKIRAMKDTDDVKTVYIDGNTVITKKACIFAEENDVDLILVKDPIINEAHLEVMLHPEQKVAALVKKVRS